MWNKIKVLFYWKTRKIFWLLNGTLFKKKAFEKAFIAGYLDRSRIVVPGVVVLTADGDIARGDYITMEEKNDGDT